MKMKKNICSQEIYVIQCIPLYLSEVRYTALRSGDGSSTRYKMKLLIQF